MKTKKIRLSFTAYILAGSLILNTVMTVFADTSVPNVETVTQSLQETGSSGINISNDADILLESNIDQALGISEDTQISQVDVKIENIAESNAESSIGDSDAGISLNTDSDSESEGVEAQESDAVSEMTNDFEEHDDNQNQHEEGKDNLSEQISDYSENPGEDADRQKDLADNGSDAALNQESGKTSETDGITGEFVEPEPVAVEKEVEDLISENEIQEIEGTDIQSEDNFKSEWNFEEIYQYKVATPSNLSEEIKEDDVVVSPAAAIIPEDEEEFEDGPFGFRSSGFVAEPLSEPVFKKYRGSYESSYFSEVTDARNQSPHGTCWAFASLNSAEASMIKKGFSEPDYSEFALAYFMYQRVPDPLGLTDGDYNALTDPAETWAEAGGSAVLASFNLSGWNGGAIDESDAPYEDFVDDNSLLNDSLAYQNSAVLKKALFFNKEDRDAIKEAVVKFGAVMIAYDAENMSGYTKKITAGDYAGDGAFFHKTKVNNANHAVSIIGWDDDFKKEYFNSDPLKQPEKNGAWLVKNSWGLNWPYAGAAHPGCFWMSYEEASLDTEIVASEYTSADDYDTLYYYDGTAIRGYTGEPDTDPIGNIYQAHENEKITAASFAFYTTNVPYTVQVYVSDEKMANPSDGIAQFGAPLTGETTASGIYTIDFDTPVWVRKGQFFSVVISPLKECQHFIEYSRTLSNYKFTANISEGQSFYQNNNNYWFDAAKSKTPYCFRIKAYAATAVYPEKITVTLNKSGITIGETTTASANILPTRVDSKLTFTWSSDNPSVASVDQKGNVKGIGAGDAVISYICKEADIIGSAKIHVDKKNTAAPVVSGSGPYVNVLPRFQNSSGLEVSSDKKTWVAYDTDAKDAGIYYIRYAETENSNASDIITITVINTVLNVYDGEKLISRHEIKKGTVVPAGIEPQNLKKEGQAFTGWTITDLTTQETKKFVFGESVMEYDSARVDAQWIDCYTISFKMNGYGTAPSDIIAAYGEKVSAPTAPTASGYTFGGWYTDSACSAGKKYTFSTMPLNGIKLYAKWTANTYKITFNANGHGTAPAAISATYGAKVTAPAAPTASGYTFGGWYTDAKCTKAYTFSTMPLNGITLYAKWTQNETGVEGFVTRLYRVCLDRNPDAAGKADWVNQLRTGRSTGTQAAYGFIFSAEFQKKNLCNKDYVEYLYQAFMGRKSDAGGKSYWIGKLESGTTREEVFNGFVGSQEFTKICQSYGINRGDGIPVPQYGTVPTGRCTVCGEEDGVTGFVKRLYSVCLNRQADQGGLNDWCGQLRRHQIGGKTAAYGFVFSQEFTNRNYSNEDYVEHLYEAFMGRKSDAGGKADWVGRLRSGTSRQEVFNGFAGSQEFRNICGKYGINVE